MSLYHKYGGITFWNEVLNSFYKIASNSEQIRHLFTSSNFPYIQAILIMQLEIGLNSQNCPTKTNLKLFKKYLQLISSYYKEWVSYLKEALIENYVLYEDIEMIIKALKSLKKYTV